MADQQPATSAPSKAEKKEIDFSKIKSFKDWLTAAIGAGITAAPLHLVIKGFAVTAAPFMAEAIIRAVEWTAVEYTAYRKRQEPLRYARSYRKTIIKSLKKAKPNSAEARQLKSDLAETGRSIHEINMHRIRFSVSTALPTPVAPPTPTVLPTPPLPVLPPASPQTT